MKRFVQYIVFVLVISSYGQELNLPVWTQYLADNDFVVSPTFAGIGDNLKIRANGLTQWVGIKNAPDNQSLYADIRLGERSGLGFTVYNDRNGNTIQTGGKLSFAHHLILDYTSEQYLSFGISYNINNFRIDIANFDTTYQNPTIDPYVTDERKSNNNNFDVGVLYRKERFWASLNANNILNKKIDDDVRVAEPFLLLNFQLYSGYIFGSKKNKDLEFEPSVFFQYYTSDGRSSTDLNFKARLYNRNDDYLWGGVSYRFLNDQFTKPLNLGPMVGFKKSIFYFGYSYQITINDLAGYNSGTHVVTIGVDLLRGISNCACTSGQRRFDGGLNKN